MNLIGAFLLVFDGKTENERIRICHVTMYVLTECDAGNESIQYTEISQYSFRQNSVSHCHVEMTASSNVKAHMDSYCYVSLCRHATERQVNTYRPEAQIRCLTSRPDGKTRAPLLPPLADL